MRLSGLISVKAVDRRLGAAEVVVGLGDAAPVYGALENVGGALLAEAYALVQPAGSVQSIGLVGTNDHRLRAFNVFSHGGAFGSDLAQLLELVARGELDPQVGWRGSWTQIITAVDAFRGRRVRGKAVLEVDDTD
jgi:NADPH:quinone reductase